MHDDKIADAWYSLDPWGMNVDPKIKNSVGPYGIPYRSLIPVNTEGLLTAGRIISGTRLAMSSYRVQPICATIGEAAGTAAAMAALQKTSVRNLDVRRLQNRLDEKGLFDWYRHVNMNVNNKPWKNKINMNRIFLLILVSIFTVSTASAQTTFLKKLKKGEKQTVVFTVPVLPSIPPTGLGWTSFVLDSNADSPKR